MQGLSSILLIIQTIVLARLLSPRHFGLIGIFLIVSAALESFTNSGFNKALIQRENLDRGYLDTAWTVSIIRGIILFSLLYVGSPFIVNLFNTPNALPVVRILSFSLLIKGFSNIGTIFFSRDLDFFKYFIWKSGNTLINFLVCIPLVFLLVNEWAIVWGMLAGEVFALIFSYSLSSFRPRFRFNFNEFKVLFDFGKWLFLSSITRFFAKQGDKIVVTKLLGESLLGIYMIASRIAKLPELLSSPIANVLFPAYSKFQHNPRLLKEKYTETLKVIGFFYIPLIVGMIVLAKPFIIIFLGEKWISALIPMQFLTAAVGINLISYTSQPLFIAMAKTNYVFKINCTRLLTLSIFVYPLLKYYGVNGVALCSLMITIATFLLWKIEINKLIGFRLMDLSFMLFPLLNIIFVSILIKYMGNWLNTEQFSVFLGTIVFGGVVYISIGLLIEKITGFPFLRDIMVIFRGLQLKKIKGRNV